MEPNKNYLMVGVFVLVSIIGAALFTMWLTRSGDKREYQHYLMRFTESVNGLSVGSAVKFKGVEVGRVHAIDISREDTSTVRVTATILKDAPINSSSTASLKLQGITGLYYVELTSTDPKASPIMPKDKKSLAEIPTQASGLSALVNRMPEMIDRATKLLAQVTKMLNDDNLDQFGQFMGHLQSVSENLDRQSQQLDAILKSTNEILGDVNDGQLKQTLHNLNKVTRQLSENGKGSMDEAYQLMLDLKATSRELRGAAKGLSEKPSQLLFPPKSQGVTIDDKATQ